MKWSIRTWPTKPPGYEADRLRARLDELARVMNVSKSVVTETLSCLGQPEELQALLDQGEIGGSTAYAISRAPDDATRQELTHKAIQGSLKRHEAA